MVCTGPSAVDGGARPRLVVLVNGLPAAGKTTLARTLSGLLGLPLISKDVITETHADVLGSGPPPGRSQREWNRALGAAASRTQWALLADAPAGAVVESSWRSDVRPLVAAGLRDAGVAGAVEIWCEAPVPLLRQRFSRRWPGSHPIHGAALSDDEWAAMVGHAQPLGLGPVQRLDTSGPVDVDAVASWCRANGGTHPGSTPGSGPGRLGG